MGWWILTILIGGICLAVLVFVIVEMVKHWNDKDYPWDDGPYDPSGE